MSLGAEGGWGCVGSSEQQLVLQSLFFSGLCPWNPPCLGKKKKEKKSFVFLPIYFQRDHCVSQKPLALIITLGTLWITGQFGFWFLEADEHKAGRKSLCCRCTLSEHPRAALHGPCVLEGFYWKWSFNGGLFALVFCLVVFFFRQILKFKGMLMVSLNVYKQLFQCSQAKGEPEQGKDPKMLLESQGYAGGCQLFWHISMAIVHP